MAPAVTPAPALASSSDGPAYEATHVHDVYDHIASHFSSTRYKPWPIIASFLGALPAGWVGLDAGTGNGKYLSLAAPRCCTIGLDRSRNLLTIAQTAGGAPRDVVWDDVLGHPWREGAFDYAISIATIHHLATPERRQLAVQRLLAAVAPAHGRVLIYVWAVRQDEQSKRAIPAEQDVFVPWVLSGDEVVKRYYHMFTDGELGGLVAGAAREMGLAVGPAGSGEGVEVVQDGWERSNHYVELRRWQR
ncbi:S-adenosyl-L-methionine-dependent methyltransferase [Mycena crocata]|nr:S-adenosyl-L-methionine-dependent methyltransferase [Mycena crocata]